MDCVSQASSSVRVSTAAPTINTGAARVTPIVTYVLIAINLVVFGAVVLQAGGFTGLGRSTIMQQGALISGGGFENEYWRLLTSGFLHWSVTHLALNMISLYLIGADLERLFGKARYLAVYLIGLLGGSAAVMALQPDLAVTAGASGAIYGLMGALLVVVLRLKLSPTMVIAVIVINVVLSLSIPNISLLGHFGGLVFGAASAAAILWVPVKVLSPEAQTYQKVTRIGWYGLAVLAVLALAIGTAFAVEASVG